MFLGLSHWATFQCVTGASVLTYRDLSAGGKSGSVNGSLCWGIKGRREGGR